MSVGADAVAVARLALARRMHCADPRADRSDLGLHSPGSRPEKIRRLQAALISHLGKNPLSSDLDVFRNEWGTDCRFVVVFLQ